MSCADLSGLQFFLGQFHQAADLGGDAEVFEKALVRRPELAPQRLPAHQAQIVGSAHEQLQSLGPLRTGIQSVRAFKIRCN